MGFCSWKATQDEKLPVRSEYVSCFGLLSAWPYSKTGLYVLFGLEHICGDSSTW